MTRRNWSREELIVAFNLYCKIPFGKIHIHNPDIKSLAKVLGRTPSAVSWKLANFARLDPALQKRAISGATHGGKGEIEVWGEFNRDWEKLSYESEKLLAQMTGKKIEDISEINKEELPKQGKEREAIVRVRINQNFFRSAVLASYDSKCCITDLAIPELLNASHIKPWAKDVLNRVNPRNGLCLNVLHDRAFDRGLITVTPEYDIKTSRFLHKHRLEKPVKDYLLKFNGKRIKLPSRFSPDLTFLEYHNKNIFEKSL